MSSILLIDDDPVFAAVLEDHLRVAGHRVRNARDSAQGLAATAEHPVDLVILERDLPVVSGLELVRQLRRAPATRAVPIVVLSKREDRDDRIALLRAGADEHLPRPVDFEELELRIARLLGQREQAPPVLDGDLASHPLRDLLQYVRNAGKTGRLALRSSAGTGGAWIERGDLVEARWRDLRGEAAVLTMLGIAQGRFRFESMSEVPAEVEQTRLPLHELMFRAAWIEDELNARRAHLPATGAPLRLRASLPLVPDGFAGLPMTRVYERIRARPGTRIFDLLDELGEPPSHVRLAVAWLIEQEAIGTEEQEAAVPNTSEITSSMVLSLTVTHLLAAAQRAGFDATALPFLVVAEQACWPQLKQTLQGVPGYLHNAELRDLVAQVEEGRAGSTPLRTEVGMLSLHVQVLGADERAARAPVEKIVPLCAGVLLWLERAPFSPGVAEIVNRLDATRSKARGLIVAADPAAEREALELLGKDSRWRLSRHPPKSLIGVLRLLDPAA